MPFESKKISKSAESYNRMKQNAEDISSESILNVSKNLKAEYDMFGYIYSHIATIRARTSDLGSLVRINNSNSPNFLDMYHTQIYAFLEQVSVILPNNLVQKITENWLSIHSDIQEFHSKRRVVPNMKIPFQLIQRLDNLHRIALLAAQKAGLGIKITFDTDINAAIESAILGS